MIAFGFSTPCYLHDGPVVDMLFINEELRKRDKYDNTIADLEFGRNALESDILDRQVEELMPPVDEGGHPIPAYPSAHVPEPAYPKAQCP